MQEVALAAVKQAAPLADPAKVAPWLYRLAVLQSLLYRRKCGRRRRLVGRFADEVEHGGWSPPVTPDPLAGCWPRSDGRWCGGLWRISPRGTPRFCSSSTRRIGTITRSPPSWESATPRSRLACIEPHTACGKSWRRIERGRGGNLGLTTMARAKE